MNENCSTIILSAGKSERMNSHKSFLYYDEIKKITFIEQLIHIYRKFKCSEIICVFNPENITTAKKMNLNAKLICNKDYEQGRFSSIKAGIKASNTNNYCFIQNIDNPFISVQILEKIFKAKEQSTYISPRFLNKGGHPILLSPEICTEIQIENSKNLNLRDFLQLFKRKNVYINDYTILININTKKEFLKQKSKFNPKTI
ncbi:MAG: NTP transferase domain-containing protein [Bacteroidota bacterium]|nr:NTP transferase domain-containing protein [Bacteroidota bacterium]